MKNSGLSDLETHRKQPSVCADGSKLLQILDELEKIANRTDELAQIRLTSLHLLRFHAPYEVALAKMQETRAFVNDRKYNFSPSTRFAAARMYAVFLLDNENWAEAETIYKELVAEQKFRSLVQKEKAQIYWEAGQAQFQRGLLSEAIQTWQQIEGWQKDSHMVSSIKMARERLKEQQEVRNTRAQRYKS